LVENIFFIGECELFISNYFAVSDMRASQGNKTNVPAKSTHEYSF
jgi:hypothetical protein